MNLPHGKLLLFARECMERKEEYVVVHCIFPTTPTLAMFLEAAAQSTAGFIREKKVKMGFLTMGKDIKILNNINDREYFFHIYKDVHIGQYHQFNFEAFVKETEIKTVSGAFTLQIEV
jgi:hypothetical protein